MRDCTMPSALAVIAGINGISMALEKYLRTSEEDRFEKVGGGYASAFVINYFTKKSIGLNQETAIKTVRDFAESQKGLDEL